MRTERPAGRSAPRGFALVLALWTIVIVLALAAALDAWVESRVTQARLIRERVQDELDAYSTRETVLYVLGTQRYTRAGLTTDEGAELEVVDERDELRIDPVGDEIALDGTPYRGIGRIRFALQDQSGLIALNGGEGAALGALLGTFSDDEIEVHTLLDALADYRDGNSLRRLNGAERDEYLALGLAPPPNRDLAAPPEIRQVLGWSEWLARHPEFRLHEWFSTARVGIFNPNVAPQSLLEHLPEFGAERAQAVVEERRRDPFRSVPDFAARTDVDLAVDEEEYRFFPSESLQLEIWREGASQVQMLALQLLPLGRRSPVQVGSTYRASNHHNEETHEVPGQFFSTGAPAAR